jgi:hypothetical protein
MDEKQTCTFESIGFIRAKTWGVFRVESEAVHRVVSCWQLLGLLAAHWTQAVNCFKPNAYNVCNCLHLFNCNSSLQCCSSTHQHCKHCSRSQHAHRPTAPRQPGSLARAARCHAAAKSANKGQLQLHQTSITT